MSAPVIFSNIIGFDGLIFIMAAANGVIFHTARSSAVKLYDSMHRHVYMPSCGDDIRTVRKDTEKLTDRKVSALREKAVGQYTLYGNMTGLFPLMGILGTVISLLGMVDNMSDIEGGFFAALTSTFWGLVFDIAFKFMDGFISPKLDDGERAAELFMQRRAANDPSVMTEELKELFEEKTAAETKTEKSDDTPKTPVLKGKRGGK